MRKNPESVEGFFGVHAGDYAKSQSHAQGADLIALVAALKTRPTDTALDVATGTGFTAIALANGVKHVVGIDVTNEMLGEARKLASAKGLSNVEFVIGDALRMKFASSAFDIVTSRRATHHFQDVPKFLHEASRVLKPGGRLGVVDMSPPEGAEAFSNKIEKLRDASHVEAFTPNRWKSMVTEASFQIRSLQVLGEHISFKRWLYPVELGGVEEASVRSAWREAGPEVRRLLRAEANGDIKGWTKSRIVLVAFK